LVDKGSFAKMIDEAKSKASKRKFKQTVELYVILDPFKVKAADVNINEVVNLPNKLPTQASICVLAAGDLALRAKKANVDAVVAPEELDRLGTNKKDAKKLAREHDFFLADTSLMPRVGKSLGPYLGPRGKMPLPITVNSPLEAMIDRLRSSVRIRTRAHAALSCKIGTEDMESDKLATNAIAVLENLEKKLPNGLKSVKKYGVKLSMSPIVKTTGVVS
jgi:large subunit ribosomal protein L1